MSYDQFWCHISHISCRNLLAMDKNGLSDPYINVNFDNYEKFKVPKKKKTLNPIWEKFNKTFMYPTRHLRGLKKKKMILEVWDHDVMGSDDFIGKVEVDLHTLASGSIKHVLTLFTKQHSKAGEIEFQFVMKHITSVKVTLTNSSVRDLKDGSSKNKYFMKMEPISNVEYKSEETPSSHGPSPSWDRPHSLLFESISLSKFKREGMSLRLYKKGKLKSLSKLVGSCSVDFDVYLKKRDFDEVDVEKELRNNDNERSGVVSFKMDFHHLPKFTQLVGGCHTDTESVGRRLLLDSEVPRNFRETAPLPGVKAMQGGKQLFQKGGQQPQQQQQQQQRAQQPQGNMYIPGSQRTGQQNMSGNVSVEMNLPKFAQPIQQQQRQPQMQQRQTMPQQPVNKFLQFYQSSNVPQQGQGGAKYAPKLDSYNSMVMPSAQNKFMQQAYILQQKKLQQQQQQQQRGSWGAGQFNQMQQQQQQQQGGQRSSWGGNKFLSQTGKVSQAKVQQQQPQQRGMYNIGGTMPMPQQQQMVKKQQQQQQQVRTAQMGYQMPKAQTGGYQMPTSQSQGGYQMPTSQTNYQMPTSQPQQQQKQMGMMPQSQSQAYGGGNRFMQYYGQMQQQQQQPKKSTTPMNPMLNAMSQQQNRTMSMPQHQANPFVQPQVHQPKSTPVNANPMVSQMQNPRVNTMPQMQTSQFQNMMYQQQQQQQQQQGQGQMGYNKFLQFSQNQQK